LSAILFAIFRANPSASWALPFSKVSGESSSLNFLFDELVSSLVTFSIFSSKEINATFDWAFWVLFL